MISFSDLFFIFFYLNSKFYTKQSKKIDHKQNIFQNLLKYIK